MNDKTSSAAPDAAKSEVTAAVVARALAAKGVKVRVPKTDRDGKPVMLLDANKRPTGVYDVIERTVTAGDILSFRESDGHLSAVTVDGQKISA